MQLSSQELVKALIKGLKLDDNIFNYQAVAEEVEAIEPNSFMEFYKKVMSVDNFGNGLKVIIDVAKEYKATPTKSAIEIKAEKLIEIVRDMNNAIYTQAIYHGRSFEQQLQGSTFTNISEGTIEVLNNVRPHFNYKKLVANINHYDSAVAQKMAFIQALKERDNAKALPVGKSRVVQMIENRAGAIV